MHYFNQPVDNMSHTSFQGLKWLLSGLSTLATVAFVVALEAMKAL